MRTLLEDRAILVKVRLCALYKHPQAQLFRQLVDLFQFYMAFPINDHTGEMMTEEDVTSQHYEKVRRAGRGEARGLPLPWQ